MVSAPILMWSFLVLSSVFGKHGGGLEDGSLFRVRLNAEEDYFLRHYNVNLEE